MQPLPQCYYGDGIAGTLSKRDFKKYVIFAGIVIVVTAVDQLTKAVVWKMVPLYDSIHVINGFFNLTHIQNPGGAFGFLADQHFALRNLLFLVISLIALGLVFYFYMSTPKTHQLLGFGFALIFGGAVGNLIDRIRMGRVIDFIDIYFRSYHWPAFNIADSAISLGIIIFLAHAVFKKLPY